MLNEVRRRADEFDMIHFHVDLLQFPLFQGLEHKCITTLHGRLDLPDYHPAYRAFPEMPLVSISDDQRTPAPPGLNWVATIHHGLPLDACPFNPAGGDYLAFLGRIAPEKRPDRAIEIAKRTGVPLKIAAKVDKADQDYFEEVIEPLLDHPLVEFIGEIGDQDKGKFLGNALALVFPIDWPEPFGLVMIEAMSTGTPTIAWRRGSVPEVIRAGRNGLVVDSIADAVRAVEEIGGIARGRVRAEFEARFTAGRMAEAYVRAYEAVITAGEEKRSASRPGEQKLMEQWVPREAFGRPGRQADPPSRSGNGAGRAARLN
jgi:glycosyltransferase involved in cell wall biosynthesis